MDDEGDIDIIDVGVVDSKEWPEEKRQKRPFPKELPASSDREFWGEDAVLRGVNKQDIEMRRQQLAESINGKHRIQIVDGDMVCNSCPYAHTVSMNT